MVFGVSGFFGHPKGYSMICGLMSFCHFYIVVHFVTCSWREIRMAWQVKERGVCHSHYLDDQSSLTIISSCHFDEL